MPSVNHIDFPIVDDRISHSLYPWWTQIDMYRFVHYDHDHYVDPIYPIEDWWQSNNHPLVTTVVSINHHWSHDEPLGFRTAVWAPRHVRRVPMMTRRFTELREFDGDMRKIMMYHKHAVLLHKLKMWNGIWKLSSKQNCAKLLQLLQISGMQSSMRHGYFTNNIVISYILWSSNGAMENPPYPVDFSHKMNPPG